MKVIEKKHQVRVTKPVFTHDPSLDALDNVDLFPEKTARAKERFKTLKLPQR